MDDDPNKLDANDKPRSKPVPTLGYGPAPKSDPQGFVLGCVGGFLALIGSCVIGFFIVGPIAQKMPALVNFLIFLCPPGLILLWSTLKWKRGDGAGVLVGTLIGVGLVGLLLGTCAVMLSRLGF